jgi:probable rRNA maturation factor
MELTIQIRHGLTAPSLIRAQIAAKKLLSDAGRLDAEVSVVLTDDSEIRELNRLWRRLDKATDVLSWPQSGAEEAPSPVGSGRTSDTLPDILGDVVISLDTAARQAAVRDWDISDETALLLVHGILHLLGHEDETEEGASAMKVIEEDLLGKPLEKV